MIHVEDMDVKKQQCIIRKNLENVSLSLGNVGWSVNFPRSCKEQDRAANVGPNSVTSQNNVVS